MAPWMVNRTSHALARSVGDGQSLEDDDGVAGS